MPSRSYTHTLICQQTGMLITFISSLPDGDYSAIHSHPNIPMIHSHIAKHGHRAPKDVIAGGILHTLRSSGKLVFCSKYPATLMGEFNAALCKHNPYFLMELYNAVQTACYGKQLVKTCSLNLAAIVSGKWSIINAIEAITGREFGASPEKRSEVIAKKLMASPAKKLASMNLGDIFKRIPRLISLIKGDFEPAELAYLEEKYQYRIPELTRCIPVYLELSAERRYLMAGMLKELCELGQAAGILHTGTQLRSFQRAIDLILDMKTRPAELDKSDSLMDLIL